VLGVGSNAVVMLDHALAAGAWWGVGWARPSIARQARALADALGFTRLDIVPAVLDRTYDFCGSMPRWLEPYLPEAVVFLQAIRRHSAIPASLGDLPWHALVYDGQPDESLADADAHVRAFQAQRVTVAHRTYTGDGESRRPLILLLRRDATANEEEPALSSPPRR
jgi:hypothetical protein